MACKLAYPLNQILFVDRRCYTYKRWHVLGIVAFYAQRYKEGKEACLKAIMSEDQEIDITNLAHYLNFDRELYVQKISNNIPLRGFSPYTVENLKPI